jgi:hypothetical protein
VCRSCRYRDVVTWAVPASQSVGSSSSWPVVIVASCALLFTIGSFWWINVRRGRLRTYPPASFAASLTSKKLIMCLPIVLYNTGAAPLVVLMLRLRFVEASADARPVPWQNTRDKLPPDQTEKSLAASFAVPGRTACQLFLEFSQDDPDYVPPAATVSVRLEARLGHSKKWKTLMIFPMRLDQVKDPKAYLAWGNDETYV